MLLRQEHVPRIPHFALRAGVGCGKRDMEPALEQLDLRLRLVVPVAAPPGPRVAWRRGFRNDHDALPLPLRAALALDRRLDFQGLLVHEEVVAVEPMPGRSLAVERDGVLGPRRPVEAKD